MGTPLSARQIGVLELVAAGATNKEIARSLGISMHTVRRHLSRTMARLQVRSRVQAAAAYRDMTGAACAPAAAEGRRLTPREKEVLRGIAQGATNREIAAELGLSPCTVKTHAARILEKLGVARRIEAAALAPAG